VTVETFKSEIKAALRSYERHVVCLEKRLQGQECEATLYSLVSKALAAYEGRAPGLRHGIALDKHLTVIISQTESERPLCGIYFNLSSPYQRVASRRAPRPSS